MIIKPEYLTDLKDWTEDKFYEWLDGGLQAWFSDNSNQDRACFYPMHTFIGLESCLAADLASIHNVLKVLSPLAASRMRNGIVTLLSAEDNEDIAATLLDLASATLAEYVVEVIPKKLLSFATDNSNASKRFLIKALFAVSSVSDDSGNGELSAYVISALKAIVNSLAFSDNYSGAVLTTFCRIHPANLNEYLEFMMPHLDKAYGYETDASAEMRSNLIEEVGNLVGRDILRATRGSTSQTWWCKAVSNYLEETIPYKNSIETSNKSLMDIFNNNERERQGKLVSPCRRFALLRVSKASELKKTQSKALKKFETSTSVYDGSKSGKIQSKEIGSAVQ